MFTQLSPNEGHPKGGIIWVDPGGPHRAVQYYLSREGLYNKTEFQQKTSNLSKIVAKLLAVWFFPDPFPFHQTNICKDYTLELFLLFSFAPSVELAMLLKKKS